MKGIQIQAHIICTQHRTTVQIGRCLKGLGHEMNIFLKAYKNESALHVYAPLVFKILGCLVEMKNKYKDTEIGDPARLPALVAGQWEFVK
jgi:hypothetical protein